MDAVAFPPPPAPFLDDGFDFGDFSFAAPQPPPPATFAAAFDDDWGDFEASPLGSNPDPRGKASPSWEKPRGPLPLSLFGADEEEEESAVEPPPPPPLTATAHQAAPPAASNGVKPADLRGLFADLYGSHQPPPSSSPADEPEAGVREVAAEEGGDGFGDDGWEFTAAAATDGGEDGGKRAHGDGIKASEDMSSEVELYKHSVSTLHTLELASKEEQCYYVRAWDSLLLSCAQELQHGAVLWKKSCHASVCDIVISQGGHCFIALGEIYRVAQILHLSLQSFKPWVLANPGMLTKMLDCWNRCINAWTCGLGAALRMIVDSNNLDTPVAKALLESIDKINEIEAVDHQTFLSSNKMACRLTLLPISLVPGMEVILWDDNHYFLKVANLWANRVSSDRPQFSSKHVS